MWVREIEIGGEKGRAEWELKNFKEFYINYLVVLKKKIDASIYFKMFHYSFISNKDMEVNNLVAYTVSNTEYTIP